MGKSKSETRKNGIFPHLPCIQAESANQKFVKSTDCQKIAEIGIYNGYTSELLAEHLSGRGELHLIDFRHRVTEVKAKLNAAGYHNIVIHGNSRKTYDSYTWSLMRLLQKHEKPLFDCVFLDGAHTWQVDALTFFLIDKADLLRGGEKAGGIVVDRKDANALAGAMGRLLDDRELAWRLGRRPGGG